MTYDHDLIILFVDPHQSHLNWDSIQRTLYHEVIHAINRIVNPWENNKTLLDMVISEGIATVVESQFSKNSNGMTHKWSKMSHAQIQKILKIMNPDFDLDNFYIQDYFGSAKTIRSDLPEWAGYFLGYYLIQSFIKMSHCDLTTLLRIPYAEIKKSLTRGGIL